MNELDEIDALDVDWHGTARNLQAEVARLRSELRTATFHATKLVALGAIICQAADTIGDNLRVIENWDTPEDAALTVKVIDYLHQLARDFGTVVAAAIQDGIGAEVSR